MKWEKKDTSECYLSDFFFNDTCALHDEKPIYSQISQRKEEWCLLVLSCRQASADVTSSTWEALPRPLCLGVLVYPPGVHGTHGGIWGTQRAVSIYTLSHTQVRKTGRRSSKEFNYLAAGGWPRCQDKERGWERKWEVEPAQVPSAIRAADSSAGHSGSRWRTLWRLIK